MNECMRNCRVKCDEIGCGWIQDCEPSLVPTWHHKPCPKCGKGEIISDRDMIIYTINTAVLQISDIIDPERKDRVMVHVDSAMATPTAPAP